MKYDIGNIVVLVSGEKVYITAIDEKQKKYTGFDIDNSNPVKYITFTDASIIMKV